MGNSFGRRGWPVRLAGAAFAFVLITLGSVAQADVASVCREDTVQIRGDWGQVRFTVEVARTVQEKSVGLMNRPAMAISAGMLFVYDRPQPVSFWMRNTLIPLDMLFVDARGVVQNIHHRAIPLDETGISGGQDTIAVLEINGGLAEQLGIVIGSQMRHPSFAADLAIWPCL